MEGSDTYWGSKNEGSKHRAEREKVGRGERDRKTAIQTDTGERTGIGRGETNYENKLREPHSGKMGKE